MDKNLNEIAKDFYNINCYNNGYCDVFKNANEHYLYKDGKKIIDEIFVNIKINDEHIILETLYKTYIIKLGNNKIKKIFIRGKLKQYIVSKLHMRKTVKRDNM